MHPRVVDDRLPPWIAKSLGYVLARVGAIAIERFRSHLEELDIRPRHYSVLSVLHQRTEPSPQYLVAGCIELDPSSLVEVIDEMEARGLVRRERDPSDRRRNVLIMTERGRDILQRARRVATDAEEELFGHLSPADRQRLVEQLSPIIQTAGGDPGTERPGDRLASGRTRPA